jgi:hypothetical protein
MLKKAQIFIYLGSKSLNAMAKLMIRAASASLLLGLCALVPAQAVEALSKDEVEKFVGTTITYTDGRKVAIGKDGICSVTKPGQAPVQARCSLASGNILQMNWGPRNEQRDLFYKDKGKFFVVDRWGRRFDIASVLPTDKLPEISVKALVETTGSLNPSTPPLQLNVQVDLDITPEMIDAGVQVLTARDMADDNLATRSAVERMFREMIAARQRQSAR